MVIVFYESFALETVFCTSRVNLDNWMPSSKSSDVKVKFIFFEGKNDRKSKFIHRYTGQVMLDMKTSFVPQLDVDAGSH